MCVIFPRPAAAARAALLIETDRRPAVVLVCRHLKLLKEGREEGTDATYQLIPLDVPSPSSASVRSAVYPGRPRALRPPVRRSSVALLLTHSPVARSSSAPLSSGSLPRPRPPNSSTREEATVAKKTGGISSTVSVANAILHCTLADIATSPQHYAMMSNALFQLTYLQIDDTAILCQN